MSKIQLTKTELKKQKDALKRYERYLPMLALKKQQLQMEIEKIHMRADELAREIETLKKDADRWVSVFAEDVNIKSLVKVKTIRVSVGNIAGIDIPVVEGVEFEDAEYDLLMMPLWVEPGIELVKKIIAITVKRRILLRQAALVAEELRITTQRVNLFEKVKVPESKGHIRKIRIALGDMQTAAVVTGKIAKKKIEEKQAA